LQIEASEQMNQIAYLWLRAVSVHSLHSKRIFLDGATVRDRSQLYHSVQRTFKIRKTLCKNKITG